MSGPLQTKLHFWPTFIEAHRLLWCDRATLARYALPWFVLLVVADAVLNWVYFPRSQIKDPSVVWPDLLHGLAVMLLPMVIGAIVYVRIHRRILLAEDMQPSPIVPPLQLLFGYLARWLALGFFLLVPLALGAFMILSLSGWVSGMFGASNGSAESEWGALDTLYTAMLVALIIPAAYIPTRLAMILPATAIASPKRILAEAWPTTRGHFWPLFWGGFLGYWPLIVATAIAIAMLGLEDENRVEYVAKEAILTTMTCASGLIWVAFFSLAYRHLVMRTEPS